MSLSQRLSSYWKGINLIANVTRGGKTVAWGTPHSARYGVTYSPIDVNYLPKP